MPDKGKNVKAEIRRLLRDGPISSGTAADHLGVSRQAAHYHLRSMMDAGEIIRLGPGRGRGTKYTEAALVSLTVALRGLSEDDVWRGQLAGISELAVLDSRAFDIHQYAFTEMLNNAIEHSEGSRAEVRIRSLPSGIQISVADDGVGVFTKIAMESGLRPDEVAGELSKGKLTTDPEHHTGEGIFFTARAVARFILESDGQAFVAEGGIDSLDWTIGKSSVTSGTRVTWDVPTDPAHSLSAVFERFAGTSDFGFSRSDAHVALFSGERSMVSRSEARRLANRLEDFESVIIDFSGVEMIGQGFADELFRVWAGRHPQVALEVANVVPAVERMIEHVRPSGTFSPAFGEGFSTSVGSNGATLTQTRGGSGHISDRDSRDDSGE